MQGTTSKSLATIKKTCRLRCTACGRYVQDAHAHIRDVHQGRGFIETAGTIEPIQQVGVVQVPQTIPVMQATNPFYAQYSVPQPQTPQLDNSRQQGNFISFSEQYPDIMQMQEKWAKRQREIDEERKRLDLQQERIAGERQQVQAAQNALIEQRAVPQHVGKAPLEDWLAQLSQLFRFNYSVWTVFMVALALYVIVCIFEIDTHVYKMMTPLVSLEGRRLLEARGQVVQTHKDYEALVKAEWLNLHQSLENTNNKGNENLKNLKLKVKATAMSAFPVSTFDEVYIMLHNTAQKVDRCSSIAQVDARGSVNAYTDKLVACLSKTP